MARWRDYLEPGDIPDLPDTPEPEPDVPRAIGVLFGAQTGWSPARENQVFGQCSICGNGREHTPIQPGSRIVCGGCGRYGLDREIREMLADNPAPAADAPPKPEPKPKAAITVPTRFKYTPRG